RGAHPPEALHERGHGRRRLEVARYPGGAVAVEEHPLPGQRGEGHQDVGLELRTPVVELVLGRDARHHAEVIAAFLDGGDVDFRVLAGSVGGFIGAYAACWGLAARPPAVSAHHPRWRRARCTRHPPGARVT